MTAQHQRRRLKRKPSLIEFSFFDDWEDRYQLLIDQGRKLAPIFRRNIVDDDHRLRGCQSVVYFASETPGW
jgi:cysteine desulfuration protein SufE